jgi:hypothetical protein
MNGRKQGARFLKYRRSIDRRSDLARPSATPDQGRGLGAGRGGKIGIGKSVKRSAPEEVTWLFMGTAALESGGGTGCGYRSIFSSLLSAPIPVAIRVIRLGMRSFL